MESFQKSNSNEEKRAEEERSGETEGPKKRDFQVIKRGSIIIRQPIELIDPEDIVHKGRSTEMEH